MRLCGGPEMEHSESLFRNAQNLRASSDIVPGAAIAIDQAPCETEATGAERKRADGKAQ